MRRLLYLVLPAALALLTAACSQAPKPNILLITLDTTRADHIGCYGQRPGLTPNIDTLADHGVRFERCLAPSPITLPSHVSILTGQYPVRHGVRDNSVYILSERAWTLAEVLAGQGYRTGASVSCIAVTNRFGVAQGFERFDQGRLIVGDGQQYEGGQTERDGAEVTRDAIEFLNKASADQSPFFYWAHFFDPHGPYNWHLDLEAGPATTAYEMEVRYVDHQVGKILAALKAQGLEENTLIIITADHGEGLGSHNESTHLVLTYESTLSVPLIVAGPGIAQGRVVASCLARLVDLMPTVLEMVEAEPPTGVYFDGESLLEFCLIGPLPEGGPEIAYFETMGPVSFDWSPLDGVSTLEWKYIRGPFDELYHLPSDPGELVEMKEKRPDILNSMARTTQAYAKILSESGEICDMAGRQTELFGSLGYISLDAHARRPSRNAPHPREMVAVLDVLNQAHAMYVTQQYYQAIPFYEECTRLSPGSAVFYDYLGKAKRKLADHLGSIEAFQKALAINPDLIDTRLTLGLALVNVEDYAGAEKELREVIARAPQMGEGYSYLAQLFHLQERFAEELEQIEAMLQNAALDDKKQIRLFQDHRAQLLELLEKNKPLDQD